MTLNSNWINWNGSYLYRYISPRLLDCLFSCQIKNVFFRAKFQKCGFFQLGWCHRFAWLVGTHLNPGQVVHRSVIDLVWSMGGGWSTHVRVQWKWTFINFNLQDLPNWYLQTDIVTLGRVIPTKHDIWENPRFQTHLISVKVTVVLYLLLLLLHLYEKYSTQNKFRIKLSQDKI